MQPGGVESNAIIVESNLKDRPTTFRPAVFSMNNTPKKRLLHASHNLGHFPHQAPVLIAMREKVQGVLNGFDIFLFEEADQFRLCPDNSFNRRIKFHNFIPANR